MTQRSYPDTEHKYVVINDYTVLVMQFAVQHKDNQLR